MSMEKTEKPTARKLNQAREKGQVFKSKDTIDNITLLISVLAIKLFAPFIQNEFTKLLSVIFKQELLVVNNKNLLFIFYQGIFFLIKITLPILAILVLITLIANYSQVGVLFAKESLKIDFQRINPVSGFKRIFSKKSLLELLKFIVKLVIITFVVWNDVEKDLIKINTIVFHSLNFSTTVSFSWITNRILKIILILFIFSFIDYFFQKKIYMSELMMTKKEVKDELKNTEGDPLIKGKIKEKQRQIATSSLIEAASEATVLIANPTHIAICLKYEFGMSVPIVTAIARDHIALKLKEVAKENNVPIVEDRPLARALFNEAELNQPIPTEFFRVVAQLLVSIMNNNPK